MSLIVSVGNSRNSKMCLSAEEEASAKTILLSSVCSAVDLRCKFARYCKKNRNISRNSGVSRS